MDSIEQAARDITLHSLLEIARTDPDEVAWAILKAYEYGLATGNLQGVEKALAVAKVMP